jgi:hypothetical protein
VHVDTSGEVEASLGRGVDPGDELNTRHSVHPRGLSHHTMAALMLCTAVAQAGAGAGRAPDMEFAISISS